ncbi:Npun_R2821/Npun_R2822 family protein [Oxynema aestuarii]|uniref:Methionine synthase n=1 Tax=Oxynema aestuarii AP17 TaxID=2064643 RepID=A0A6H1U197_9CYAN|nr:Npun_R2821/Npun_R2822 family protein [Oxynema aestuarii]QIZ71940.1 methionine synthase [Oxynema aestuarii AP17]
MTRGIYITANDRAIEQTIALLKSIRLHDRETAIVLIPYDDNYRQLYAAIGEKYGVTVYEDLDFIKRLSENLQSIFGENFFARPNQFRKQACWFGPFDEFLYIDTDIVVFEKIVDNLDYLQEYDFIYCDYQFVGGIKNVFTNQVFEDNVFTQEEVKDIFNGGFWGSKKNLISEQDLYDSFNECARHPEYFDFSQKTSDQPIVNYMMLKRIPRRFNIVRRPGGAPGSWAGSAKFKIEDNIPIDPDVKQPLQYLHWAGIRIEPGCPYWEIWEHYRYLNEPKPERSPEPPSPPNLLQQIIGKIKRKFD